MAEAVPAREGEGGGDTPPVTVVYGANTARHPELVGRRVGEAREFLAEAMNLPQLPRALIGGRGVERDYVLRPGDRLEFVEEQGRKA